MKTVWEYYRYGLKPILLLRLYQLKRILPVLLVALPITAACLLFWAGYYSHSNSEIDHHSYRALKSFDQVSDLIAECYKDGKITNQEFYYIIKENEKRELFIKNGLLLPEGK